MIMQYIRTMLRKECYRQKMENRSTNEEGSENINDLVVKNNILTFVMVAFIIVSGIVGNGFSFAFYGFVEKKTVTSFLISVLAGSDLFSSIIYIEQLFVLSFMLDFQSKFACSLIRFLKTICIGNSYMLLGPVGLDRCLKICVRNPRYHLTLRKAVILSLTLIIFSVSRSFRQFYTNDIKDVDVQIAENKTVLGKICTKTDDITLTPLMKVFGAIDGVCFIVINTAIVVVYLLIIRKVTQVQRKVNSYPSRSGLSNQAGNYGNNPNAFAETIERLTWNRTESETLGQTCSTQLGVSTIHEDVAEIVTISKNSKRQNCVEPFDMPDDKISQVDHAYTNTDPGDNYDARGNNMKSNPKLPSHKSRSCSQIQQIVRGNSACPKRHTGNKVETNLSIMLSVVAFSSLFCYVPYVVISYSIGPIEVYTKYSLNALIQTGLRSPLLNSSINPYVIGLFNSKFRQFVNRVIKIPR